MHTLIVLTQGDTVALQTYVRNAWVGCSGTICKPAPCPGGYFDGSDWSNCWGEVFEIYKSNGPSDIHSGDLVGFHYPRENGKWLGCSDDDCKRAPCPGKPTTAYGFSSPDKWVNCWGEVFKIYGYSKNNGDDINSGDEIMLQYVNTGQWVDGNGDIDKATCPGSAPPHTSKFDTCSFQVFKIVERI